MREKIKKSYIVLAGLLMVLAFGSVSVSAAEMPSVTYQTHVQNVGWQDYVAEGKISGTEGMSYRLEGIRIALDSSGYDLGIQYQTHIQNIGWEEEAGRGWKTSKQMSGTEGLSYRLEAIQIKLTGTDAEKFDIYYQVHAQNVGWMGWAKNGESAGTAGYGYRLEGIKIQIVSKGANAPGSIENAYKEYVKPKYKEAYAKVIDQAYKEFVDKYATGSYKWLAKYASPYSLFDMDSNGTPELFIRKGNCEANYTFYIYTFKNEKSLFVGTFHAGHSGLSGVTSNSNGQILVLYGQMGVQHINELYLNNDMITYKTIMSGEVDSYFRTDYPVPEVYANDLSLLNSF